MPVPSVRRSRGTRLALLLAAGAAMAGAGPGPAMAASEASEGRPCAPAGFADLVQRARPAVVAIAGGAERGPAAAVAAETTIPSAARRTAAGVLGSGFLIDSEGHVVTNDHVVAGVSRVTVALEDGRSFDAVVVGRDPLADLALLRVAATDAPLPFLPLGDSERVRPGDWVVALGSRLGQGAVRAGLVSDRGDGDLGAGRGGAPIRVEVPIGRDASGGPLIAADGTVVGVGTAAFDPGGGEGLAIPAELVRREVAALAAAGGGRVAHGWLGALTQPLDARLAAALRLGGDAQRGALVAGVVPGGPADRAGIRPGDVIVAAGTTAVEGPRDLARAIDESAPGTALPLTLRREGGAEATLQAVLGDVREEAAAAPARPTPRGGDAPAGELGLALGPVTAQTRRVVGLDAATPGAVVTRVAPDGLAAAAGLRPGDVVLGVGASPVASPTEAMRAIRDAWQRTSGGTVALRIVRDGLPGYVAVRGGTGQ